VSADRSEICDLDANRTLVLAAIREAVRAEADVVVLPELITSGYMLASTEEAASVAINPGHEILPEWAAEAARAEIVLVGGFCELGDDGEIRNSAAGGVGQGTPRRRRSASSPRPARANSDTPSSRSSRRTWSETASWVQCVRVAALNDPSSAAVRK
jgi:Carbon-nitrogen hydrolase